MRIKLLSASSGTYVGFAKKKFKELERIRKRLGQKVLSKRIVVSEHQVWIFSSEWEDRITIMGASMNPYMVLSGGGSTVLYDYIENAVSSGRAVVNGLLYQGHNKHLFQDKASDDIFKVNGLKLTSQREIPAGIDAAGFIPTLNLSVAISAGSLRAYRSEEQRFIKKVDIPPELGVKLATLNGQQTKRLTSHIIYAGALYLPTTTGSGTWNNMVNPHFDLYAPEVEKYASFSKIWRWFPRIWNPAIGNEFFLFQGIYYGSVKGGGLFGPCVEASARFGCMLDNRGGSEPFGYCEILASTTYKDHEFEPDGTQDHLKAYFFRDLWEPGRDIFYDENYGRMWFQNDYWSSCPEADFYINFEAYFSSSDYNSVEIDWWSTKDLISDDILVDDRPHEGIIAFSPITKKWVLYRYANYSSVLKSGDGYVDHSISYDANIVTVVYEEPGEDDDILTKVFVYDFTQKEDEEAPGSGNGMIVAENIISTSKSGSIGYGQLIPFHPDKEPPIAVVSDYYADSESSDFSDSALKPSMFGMQHPWPVGNGYTASGWKVDIINGTFATGYFWIDECWQHAEYTMYHDEEVNQFDSRQLILAGGPNGRHGTASIGIGGIPSPGGSSPAGSGSTVGRSGISFGTEMLFGCLEASRNAKSELEWTGDVVETGLFGQDGGCWKPIPGCKDNDDGFPIGEVTLTDDCGETAEGEYQFDKLEVHGSWEPEIDDAYSASGGTGPYTFSSSGGLYLDSDAVVTGFGDCGYPGELRTATVTATDSCGRQAEMEVRLPGGTWVLSSQGTCDRAWYTGYIRLTFISGTTKRVIDYHASGCDCFDNMIYLSPAGSCWLYNPYTCSGDGLGYYSSGYTAYDFSNCVEQTAPAGLETLGYDARSNYGYEGDVPMGTCRANGGNNYETYGWRLWSASENCWSIYKWECP